MRSLEELGMLKDRCGYGVVALGMVAGLAACGGGGSRSHTVGGTVTGLVGGWGVAAPIETEGGGASDMQVALEASGNAVAVWGQFDSTGRPIVMVNRFE
jgi:hypothetical protein